MLFIALAVAGSAASAAAQTRIDIDALNKLRAELMEVEERSEQFKRFIPESFDLSQEKDTIRAMAAKAELPSVELKVLATENAPPLVIHKVEYSGAGSYSSAHFFLTIMRTRGRLIDSVRFDAKAGGDVRFVARLTYPVWTGTETPEAPLGDALAEARRSLERKRATLDRMVSIVDRLLIDESVDAFADFTAQIAEHRVALSSADVAGVITIDGVALGSAARTALEQALVKTKLQPARVTWTDKGKCSAFTIRTSPEVPSSMGADLPPRREFTSGAAVFDAASAEFCQQESGPTRKVVVRRAGSTDESFFMKIRNVNIVDVFYIFNDLFNENFIIDPDVRGQVDVDVHSDGSPDDVVAGMNSIGVAVAPGPLRRVSMGKAVPISTSGTGEPVTFVFRDANLSDVLCVLQNVTGREIRMSPKQQARVAVFAYELPSGLLASALTPAAMPGAVDPCAVTGPPRARLAQVSLQRFEDLSVSDVRVAAVANLPEPKSYAQLPGGALMALERGQKFRDGTVKAISMQGVTFAIPSKADVLVPLK